MPNTKITRERWKLHMQYGKTVYIILILLGVGLGHIAYTMTEPQTPNANKVDIYIVSVNANSGGFTDVAAQALSDGQEAQRAQDALQGTDVNDPGYEPALREVNVYTIAYDEANDDGYGSQAFMVRIMSMEGDIFFVTRTQLEQLISTGAVEPLDSYIADGLIDPGSRDLSKVTYAEYVEENVNPTGNELVYALQMEPMFVNCANLGTFDCRDMYMVIMSYSQNKDAAAHVMNSLIRQLDGEPAQ